MEEEMELVEYTDELVERSKARKDFLSKKVAEAKKRRTALADGSQLQDPSSDFTRNNDELKRQCLEPVGASEYSVDTTQSAENSFENKENEYQEDVPVFRPGARGLAALQKRTSAEDDVPMESITDDQSSFEPKECQGFVKSPSKAKLLYNFAKPEEPANSEDETADDESYTDCQDAGSETSYQSCKEPESSVSCSKSPEKSSLNDNSSIQTQSVRESVNHYEKSHPAHIRAEAANLNTSFEPAQLPLSARKAFFENAFSGNTPKAAESTTEAKMSVAQRAAMFEKASKLSGQTDVVPKKIHKDPLKSLSTPPPQCMTKTATTPRSSESQSSANSSQSSSAVDTKLVSPAKYSPSPIEILLSPSKNVGTHTRLVHQQLVENSTSDWRKKEIVAKTCTERKNEISALLNHWERVSSSSADTTENVAVECSKKNSSSGSEKYESVFQEPDLDESSNEEDEVVEDISQACGAESESSESDAEIESCDVYRQEDVKSLNSDSGTHHGSLSSEAAAVCNEMDNILDDALCQDEAVIMLPEMPPPISIPKSSTSSNRTSSSSSSSSGGSTSGSASSQSHVSDRNYSTTNQSNRNNDTHEGTPLLHTVSFYRRQKQQKRAAPVQTIVRRPEVPSPPSPEADNTKEIQEKIKALQEDVLAQQTVISQTSQALNLCLATEEFFGSTEQVEGERLLLIATQKRMACLNEIQRLKTEGSSSRCDGTGTLILNDIKLPLKRDFITNHISGKSGDTVHYFLCIVRYGAQVVVTQMLSADDGVKSGSLCFTNHITLHNLPPDFSVAFEVYALQTKKEVLPHDRKYHIKRDHSKIRLTPKTKKSDSKLLSPAISSPGGPNAVRSPSFGVVGFTRFTLQNCNREICTLEKVPFSSPLDGVLKLKMQLHAEHNIIERGFLTMFEDVSGFGAWHRRWGVLDGKDMAFWKYPDDEKRKDPILAIDLKQCITREVKSVPRDICARPHTFELVTVRPQEKGDKNTLISRSVNTLTTTKYLLSADTKEERILWCKRLNNALMNTRKWDPNALRPIDSKLDK